MYLTQIPNANAFVVGATVQIFAGRVKKQVAHPVLVTEQRRHTRARRRVPQSNGGVARTRRHHAAGLHVAPLSCVRAENQRQFGTVGGHALATQNEGG